VLHPFKIVALWCWYRGEQFRGYQQQLDSRTVQGELLRAFAAAGLSRNPVVAGRTDKGVSARMQVLSCRVERETVVDELPARLNAHLPGDLGVHLVREVPRLFHAAWSATSKEYRYRLTHAEAGDLERLREAAALIPGTRDFTVFHFKSSERRPRTVTAIDVWPDADGVTLRFLGEGFARYMVRMLVGAMVHVARGELDLSLVRDGLEQQKLFRCPTAEAEPLTLWDVGYPKEVDPFTSAERASFDWPPRGPTPTR
jgi:tRNA pseudouridine38-40 synthase